MEITKAGRFRRLVRNSAIFLASVVGLTPRSAMYRIAGSSRSLVTDSSEQTTR